MLLTRPSKNVYRQHRPRADIRNGVNLQVGRDLTPACLLEFNSPFGFSVALTAEGELQFPRTGVGSLTPITPTEPVNDV